MKKKRTYRLANSATPYLWFLGVAFFAWIGIKGGEAILRLMRYMLEGK